MFIAAGTFLPIIAVFVLVFVVVVVLGVLLARKKPPAAQLVTHPQPVYAPVAVSSGLSPCGAPAVGFQSLVDEIEEVERRQKNGIRVLSAWQDWQAWQQSKNRPAAAASATVSAG